MRGKFPDSNSRPRHRLFPVLGLLLLLLLVNARALVSAQTPQQTTADAATDAATAAEARIAHARALAAAHRLASAAAELDNIRTTATDESLRDIARIMLMNVYLEEGDYARADSLLTETFKARTPSQESSVQSYFALAGQTINGARHHLERYREFGINVADRALPPEAQYDLERLRQLLELIITQATAVSQENTKSTDAVALLEDAAGVRSTLAKDEEDRARWQQEFANARQRLAASETRIASISPGIPTRQAAGNITVGAVRSNNPGPVNTSPSSSSSSSSSNTKRSGSSGKPPAASNDSSGGRRRNSGNASNAANASDSSANQSASSPSTRQSGETVSANKSEGGDGGGSNAASNSAQPVDVGSLLEKARQKVNPTYPQTARSVHATGVVTVYLLVDENGDVLSVQRASGPQLLRQAAVDAAKRWKFNRTMVDGQPVRVAGFISFNFTL